MPAGDKNTTTLSTKGQLILPLAIRRKRRWEAGTKLIVEETPEGVLLRSAPLFSPSRMEEVYGIANYTGPRVPVEAMDAAILEEVKRRRARGRY